MSVSLSERKTCVLFFKTSKHHSSCPEKWTVKGEGDVNAEKTLSGNFAQPDILPSPRPHAFEKERGCQGRCHRNSGSRANGDHATFVSANRARHGRRGFASAGSKDAQRDQT